jgi:flagellar assembly factor FliW
VLNIVTLRRDGSLTVNLKGPIVYNKRTGEARQVVPINAAELPVNFPVAN